MSWFMFVGPLLIFAALAVARSLWRSVRASGFGGTGFLFFVLMMLTIVGAEMTGAAFHTKTITVDVTEKRALSQTHTADTNYVIVDVSGTTVGVKEARYREIAVGDRVTCRVHVIPVIERQLGACE